MNRSGNERVDGRVLLAPVAAGMVLKEATIAVLNANGYAEPGKLAENVIVAGCVEIGCTNAAGANGAEMVQIARGVFVWNNDGTIKATDLLKKCYIKNETTVTITPDGASTAGTILSVEPDGVVVDMTIL